MPFIESLEEFTIRQGGESVRVQEGRNPSDVFANGARIVYHTGMNSFALHEPPANDRERLELQKKFHQQKEAIYKKAFSALQGALTGHSDRFGMPLTFRWNEFELGPAPNESTNRYGEPDGKAALIRLTQLSTPHKAAIAEIDRELAELPEVRAWAEAAEALRARGIPTPDEAEQLRVEALEAQGREVLGVSFE